MARGGVAIALASARGAEHRRWQEAATREGDRYGIDPAYVRAALAGESASVSPSRRSWVDWALVGGDRKSTHLNSSHSQISYAVFCLKKKKKIKSQTSTHIRVTTKERRQRQVAAGNDTACHELRRDPDSYLAVLV